MDVLVRACVGAVHHFGQTHSQFRHALGVTQGGRVAPFNRGHRGLHETFKKVLNVAVKQVVLKCHPCLAGQGSGQILAALREGDDFLQGYLKGGYQLFKKNP